MAKNATTFVGDDELILSAGHELEPTPKSDVDYLQGLYATATSSLKSLSLASNGRLQTQKTLDKQSDSSLMWPFLLFTE